MMPTISNQNENHERQSAQSVESTFNDNVTLPFDMKEFIMGLLHPEVTEIQKHQNAILKESLDKDSFKYFVVDAYSMIVELFETYKIAPK